jgi:sigma-B regulation protein RsbU (phosphoserine phosphatase)
MQHSCADILDAFRRSELQLFIAAASISTGFVAIGFSLIRRRFDRLLSFFAWFAGLYGVRLWMQSDFYSVIVHPSPSIERLIEAINFFVSIPAFSFFGASGFVDRAGRIIVYIACLIEMCLIGAIFLGVPLPLLDKLNSSVVMGGSVSLLILAFRQTVEQENAVVFRFGMLIFVIFVVWTNVGGLYGRKPTVELYGFAAFLCCLGYIAARKALDRDQQLTSIQQELETARRIQLSILPTEFPVIENVAIAARYLPMTSVAGDFYEFLSSEETALGVLIADVAGHGVPAALIASMVKIAVQSQRHCMEDPERLLAGVNKVLCGNTQNQFVTAAYIHLDIARGMFRYSAAGHPPMFLLRAGQVYRITENGLVLALMPAALFTATTQPLLSGDRLLLYTDGIIEATNGDGEEFGYERLSDLLRMSETKSAEEAADQILSTVNSWSPSQNDDLTIIVCDYKRVPDRQVSPIPVQRSELAINAIGLGD